MTRPAVIFFLMFSSTVFAAENHDQPNMHAMEPASSASLVATSPVYNYRMLDHAEHTNNRLLLQLQAVQREALFSTLTLGGSVISLANYQNSNRDNKFGWLMRHPTSSNQIGDTVSESVVHAARLNLTARLTDSLTAYTELLYNPEQSFGSGTITDLNRNQTQIRRAWVMWGNLDQSPYYAAIGKMDIPFGLNDTVSPFTNSTVWHAFAGLAYGGTVGYYNRGLHARFMAVQGGAQFRGANAPVEDTSVPSRLNNFAADLNYSAATGDSGELLVGASYLHGSAYCQGYPVTHFAQCDENNPAVSTYARFNNERWTLLGEFSRTRDVWPGTAVPMGVNSAFDSFSAQRTSAFGLGGRYYISSDWDVSL
ncbi:MAG: hypothetical protein KJN90_02250, partial [Gammaproteobacteria bacterium]|nr:hypothetical protein [Gammaproteobacteria bacterium]